MTSDHIAAGAAVLTCISLLAFRKALNEGRRLQARQRLTAGAHADERSGKPMLPGINHAAAVITAAGCLYLLTTLGPLLALSWLGLCAIGRRSVRVFRADRADARYEAALPLFMDDLNRSLRSGAGFLHAFTEAAGRSEGALRTDVQGVCHRVALGESVAASLARWTTIRSTRPVRLCVGALTLALETGGSQARAVDSAAASVRQALVAGDVARTHATEAKASAAALTALPVLISGPVLITNPAARDFMFHSFAGQLCLCAGVGLQLAGAYCMAVMVKRVLA